MVQTQPYIYFSENEYLCLKRVSESFFVKCIQKYLCKSVPFFEQNTRRGGYSVKKVVFEYKTDFGGVKADS